MQSINEQGKMQRQKTKRIMGMTFMQITVLAILSCCSFTTIGALGWMVLSNSQQLTSPQPIAPPSLPTNPIPTAIPTLIPTTVKVKSVPSTLEQYGFLLAGQDSSGAGYMDSCGTQAVWASNKPNSVNFFIPVSPDICDLGEAVEPAIASTMSLYPTSVSDWLFTEALQTDESMTKILLGESVSKIVSGYYLIIYKVPGENILLYSISAPGEY